LLLASGHWPLVACLWIGQQQAARRQQQAALFMNGFLAIVVSYFIEV
jgi:hypothetical protein